MMTVQINKYKRMHMAIGTPRDYEKPETYTKPTSKRGFGIPFHKPRPNTHEETAPLTETEKDSNPNERRWTRRHTLGAVAGGVAITLLSGGITYVATRPRPEATPPAGPEPSASAPQTPGTPEVTPSPELDRYEIKAGLPAEEYGTALTTTLTEWSNAGATQELYQQWLLADGAEASEQVIADAVEQNKKEFANALLIQGWENNAELRKFVDGQARLNRGTLNLFVVTNNSDNYPDDVEPFNRSYTANETIETETTEQGRRMEITFTEHNNGDKNRVWNEIDPNMKNFNNDKLRFFQSTQTENGAEKITSIQLLDIPND